MDFNICNLTAEVRRAGEKLNSGETVIRPRLHRIVSAVEGEEMKPEPRIEARGAGAGHPAMVIAIFRDNRGRKVTQFVGIFESTCRDNAKDAAISGAALASAYGYTFVDMTAND
jgi:hypothetical protein